MSTFTEPPFYPGQTHEGTDAAGNLINTHLLGQIFEFEALDYSANGIRGPRALVTGRPLKFVVLRNTSGAALLGKRLGKLDESAGYGYLHNVNGYSATYCDDGIVGIDPWLPSAGCPSNDLFLGQIEGPGCYLNPTAGADMVGDIVAGAPMVAATAAGTTTTAAGRIANVTLAAQTAATAAFNMAKNLFGRALSARTTHQTDSVTTLVHVQIANRL